MTVSKTWTRQIAQFREHLGVERNLSPNTLRAYLADVRQLEAFLRENSPKGGDQSVALAQVLPRDVRNWLASLHATSSAATQGRKLASIRSFFSFLVNAEAIDSDPTEGLPVPKTPRRPPRPLPVDDCHVLLAEPEGPPSQDPDAE